MSLFKKAVLTMACLTLFTVGAHASASCRLHRTERRWSGQRGRLRRREARQLLQHCRQLGQRLGANRTGNHCAFLRHIHRRRQLEYGYSTGLWDQRKSRDSPALTRAVFTAPYWSATGGAIACNGFNYITRDGGGSSLIQNTANGTGLTYQQDSSGVDFETAIFQRFAA